MVVVRPNFERSPDPLGALVKDDPLLRDTIVYLTCVHELGHALGLEHNGNTHTLMCGPCEHLLYWSDRPLFFPLTPREHGRLQLLHQAE